jgi:hypothetical protein
MQMWENPISSHERRERSEGGPAEAKGPETRSVCSRAEPAMQSMQSRDCHRCIQMQLRLQTCMHRYSRQTLTSPRLFGPVRNPGRATICGGSYRQAPVDMYVANIIVHLF